MHRIRLHPYTIHRRATDVVISRKDESSHLVLDEESLAVLKSISGKTIEEAEKAHPDSDIEGFLEELHKHNLIRSIGHRVLTPRSVATLLDLPEKRVAWAKHPLTTTTLILLAATSILLLAIRPELLPRPGWILAPPLALIIPAAFLTCWLVSLLHEGAHYLLLRARGMRTALRLKHKWHTILPATDLDTARLLPRRAGMLVHLGGILATLGLLAILQILTLNGVFPEAARFIMAIAWIDILIQLSPLPGTDLTEALQHRTGKQLPTSLLRELLSGCDDCEKLSEWMPMLLVGLLILGLTLTIYLIPITLGYLHEALTLLLTNAGGGGPAFIHGAWALLIATIGVSLASLAAAREHHATTHRAGAWGALLTFVASNAASITILSLVVVRTTSPVISTLTLFGAGILFGIAFLRVLEHVRIEDAGFATDTVLPVLAACTALIVLLAMTWLSAQTGVPRGESLLAVSYAAGMLGALVL